MISVGNHDAKRSGFQLIEIIIKEPLLATKESDVVVVVVHLAFRPFLENWEN